MSKPMSDFQRQFLARGTGQQLYTENEFNEKLSQKMAEIMAVAIDTSKTAVMIERQACAEVALMGTDEPVQTETLEILKKERQRIHDAILNRIPTQRQ